ncbi:LOB domain-containing protein 36-like protein [Tanacetum coccineum]|uniref:LOB domain-containing protein 36-like protein n=1 Tax=Tanacetum coccineum TaxID=301880 RepID=A0ABQ5DCY1_9ASTR
MKMSSSSNSTCAACKFLHPKGTQECVFASYFPPDQPAKFASVHKVFGASNVAKIFNELSTSRREDTVHTLAYEADVRLGDLVYGCVGIISSLLQEIELAQTKAEIALLGAAQLVDPFIYNEQK